MGSRHLVVLAAALLVSASAVAGPPPARIIVPGDGGHEWLQFSSAPTEGANQRALAVSVSNVQQLNPMWRAVLPEVADGSPAYVHDILTQDGQTHDLLILTTIRGRVVALDALSGVEVWSTIPPDGPRWTTSSPAVDPNRKWIYAYALDGYVHKYAVDSGYESFGDGWPELITLKGAVEKGSSALSIVTARDGNSYLYCTISAYPEPGDDGDYQGHLVTVNLESGEQHVFNAACSDRDMHFDASGSEEADCVNRQSGIWARAGVTYDEVTDRIFVTVGNGVFDAQNGGFNWGSSVVALRPDGTTDGGTPIDSYTPVDFQRLTDEDLDLSSTTIAIIPLPAKSKLPRLGVQSGKDWMIRLINLEDMSGQGGPRHVGGELQLLKVPQEGEVHTRPATWLDPQKRSWVYITNYNGIAAFTLTIKNGKPQLVKRWMRKIGGATPIIANGVLYYATYGGIVALSPTSGEQLWRDSSIANVHWQSPILVNGNLYVSDQAGVVSAFTILRLNR